MTEIGAPRAESPSRPFAVVFYFAGAYAWTWSFNLLKILSQRDIVKGPMPLAVLDMSAGLGPLAAALAVSSFEGGAKGRNALLRQLLRWRVPRRWYAVALLGPLALVAAAFSLWIATGGSPPPTEALAQWTMIPVFLLYILLFGGGVGEELGWRGFALPRLQQRYGALTASVVIGLFWAGWHIPVWFTPGSGQDLISFPVFLASTTATAIVLTWLYNGTGGSLPLAILAHTMFNLCTTGPWFRALYALPTDQTGIDPFNSITAFIVLVAVVVAARTDPRTLTVPYRAPSASRQR